jgi:hypothetical protein
VLTELLVLPESLLCTLPWFESSANLVQQPVCISQQKSRRRL